MSAGGESSGSGPASRAGLPPDGGAPSGAGRDHFSLAARAARELGRRTGVTSHDVALVLGSGWSAVADALGPAQVELTTRELPGFPAPTVSGHAGTIRSVVVGGRQVLVLLGRLHAYEGHDAGTVVHGVRAAVLAGCRTVVLTNAAGSLRADLAVGRAVLIRDHLNLTGRSPLAGPPPPAPHGPPFVDLTDLYSARLRGIAKDVAGGLPEGVYAGLLGPSYETPAEIAMLRLLGADLVGMSTVLEAVAARHLGAEVLGLSLVTNAAAGQGPGRLDHGDVLAAGRSSAPTLGPLVAGIVALL
ncbi:MAG: purine-nucleoside phosphorylase, partial [Acidimicrobiales bacterium]